MADVPVLSGAKKLKEKAVDFISNKFESERLHQDLISLSNQYKIMQSIIEQNEEILMDKSVSDKNITKLLELYQDKFLGETFSKVESRELVTNKDAEKFVSQLQEYVDTFDEIEEKFEVSVAGIANNVKDFVTEERNSKENRDKFLNSFVNFIKTTELTKAREKKVAKFETGLQEGKLTDKQIIAFLNTFTEKDEKRDKVVIKGVSDLDKTLKGFIVTQKKIEEELEEGKSLQKFKLEPGKIARGVRNKVSSIMDTTLEIMTMAAIIIPMIAPLTEKVVSDYINRKVDENVPQPVKKTIGYTQKALQAVGFSEEEVKYKSPLKTLLDRINGAFKKEELKPEIENNFSTKSSMENLEKSSAEKPSGVTNVYNQYFGTPSGASSGDVSAVNPNSEVDIKDINVKIYNSPKAGAK
jgi:hypothetical protein